MRRAVLLMLFFVLLLTTPAIASVYEDDDYMIAVYKGWDMLESDARYVFEGKPPFESFEFIEKIHDTVRSQDTSVFTSEHLKSLFGEDYTPLFIEALVRNDVGSLRLDVISTPTNAFKGNLLGGWEKQYGELSKSMGAYYFLNVPVGYYHTLFFLLPKELLNAPVTLTFNRPRVAISLTSDEKESIDSRIELLHREIARLEGLK